MGNPGTTTASSSRLSGSGIMADVRQIWTRAKLRLAERSGAIPAHALGWMNVEERADD
jgi:hypothetical protein